MNTKLNLSDVEQPDATCGRKTLVKSKNSTTAANSASLKEVADVAELAEGGEDVIEQKNTQKFDKTDPRKVRELNADDFFQLGKFRI